MGEVIAINKAVEKVAELLPPDLPRANQGPPGGAVLGVWEAHREIERLKKELAEMGGRLREVCGLASRHKNRAEAKQAEVRTYQAAIRDLATQNHGLRNRNGDLALALARVNRRAAELEKRVAAFREKTNELTGRNARLRTDAGEFRLPVASLIQGGFGPL